MITVANKVVKNIEGQAINSHDMSYVADAMRSWLSGNINDSMLADYIDVYFGSRSVEYFARRDSWFRVYPQDLFGALVFNAKPQPHMRLFTASQKFAPVQWV